MLAFAPHLEAVSTEFVDEIWERSGGVLQGQPLTMFAENAKKLNVDLRDYKPEGGESLKEVQERIHKFLNKLVQKHILKKESEQSVLIIAHGHVIVEFYNLQDRLNQLK